MSILFNQSHSNSNSIKYQHGLSRTTPCSASSSVQNVIQAFTRRLRKLKGVPKGEGKTKREPGTFEYLNIYTVVLIVELVVA